MSNLVETTLPSNDWAKTVTRVDPRAKSGHDWDGDFVKGPLIDLEAGEVLITCTNTRRGKDVDLYVMLADGKWVRIDGTVSNDWASELRKDARTYLELEPAKRVAKAAKLAIERRRAMVVKAEKKITGYETALADIEAAVAAAPAGDLVNISDATLQAYERIAKQVPQEDGTIKDEVEAKLTEYRARAANWSAEQRKVIADHQTRIAELEAMVRPPKLGKRALELQLGEALAAWVGEQTAKLDLADEAIWGMISKALKARAKAAKEQQAPPPAEEVANGTDK